MLLRALFVRQLLRRPLRFGVTILGVAAGVAALVATLASSRAALASLREGVGEIAGATRIEITHGGGIEEGLAGLLRPLSDDALILPVVEEIALSPALDDVVRLIGIDPLVEIGTRPVELGARGDVLLRTLRGEGAWIASELARELGLAVGDALALDVRSHAISLEILGVFEAPERSSAWRRVVVVDVALAQELAGKIGRLDRIELVPRAGVDADELRARAAALLPIRATLAPPERRAAETAGMVRSLEFNLTALSGISLFVAAVLVATTLATAVVQRRSTIALLRSLGASELQIARSVLIEALVIGTLGGALGVGAGFAGAKLLLASMRATVTSVVAGAPATPIRFDAGQAWLGLAVGVVTALVAAVLPVLEARRTPPIQGLASERPEHLSPRSRRLALALAALFVVIAVELAQAPAVDGLPVAAIAASTSLLCALFAACGPAVDLLGRIGSRMPFLQRHAISLRLASAALAAGRRRAAWAAGAVGVAVALAVSIAALVTSFRATVVDWTENGLRSDLSVRPLAPKGGVPVGRLDPALVDYLVESFGRDAVDPFHSAIARIESAVATEDAAAGGGGRVTLGGAEFAVVARRGGLPFRDGSDSRATFERAWREDLALINEACALRFGLEEGDLVRVESAGRTLEREVAGVFYDYGDSQGLVVIDRADFLALHPGDGPREIALLLPADTDVAAAKASIVAGTSGRFRIEVLDREEIRAHVLAIFDGTFAITRALQAVAAAVAVIAVLSVLVALVSERQADLGLLAALGASRAQIALQVSLQAGLLGLVGSASGALAGLLIGLVLVKVVNLQSFGWTLDFRQPWEPLLLTSAWVVLACLVAGLWPAVAAARGSLRAVIRDE